MEHMQEEQSQPETLPELEQSPSETQLRQVMSRLNGASEDVLSTVYVDQMKWARHYNEINWRVGAILIPAALAGLVLSFKSDKVLDEMSFVMAAIGSSALLFFFLLISEWHRKLWHRSLTLAGVIEVTWKLKDASTKPAELDQHLLHLLTPTDYGYYLRWVLCIVGISAWIVKVFIIGGFPASTGSLAVTQILLLAMFLFALQIAWAKRPRRS
jgi:hypothetical protein